MSLHLAAYAVAVFCGSSARTAEKPTSGSPSSALQLAPPSPVLKRLPPRVVAYRFEGLRGSATSAATVPPSGPILFHWLLSTDKSCATAVTMPRTRAAKRFAVFIAHLLGTERKVTLKSLRFQHSSDLTTESIYKSAAFHSSSARRSTFALDHTLSGS